MKKTTGKEGSLRKGVKRNNRAHRDSSSSYIKELRSCPEAAYCRALSLELLQNINKNPLETALWFSQWSPDAGQTVLSSPITATPEAKAISLRRMGDRSQIYLKGACPLSHCHLWSFYFHLPLSPTKLVSALTLPPVPTEALTPDVAVSGLHVFWKLIYTWGST